MPTFVYEAVEVSGKKKKGKLEAASRTLAITQLKQDGLFISTLEEEKKTVLDKDIVIGNPVKNKHFVVFLRQLATLLGAGIRVSDSIHILARQSESKALRKVLGEVELEIQRGTQLSEACGQHPKVFSPLFLSMLRAGEASGNMEMVLERMATFQEKSYYTREKIKSAMIYPVIMIVISIGVTIYLLTNVVPMFVSMFADFGGEVPAITRSVMTVSESLIQRWYIYVAILAGAIIGFRLVFKTPKGRYAFDYALLRIPVFGPLLQKGVLARLMRTLSTLFSSSVPVLQSLTIAEEVADNKVVARAIQESKESLRQGRPLSEPLSNYWVFPPFVTHMITVGEETGALDSMLEKVAEFYEAEVESAVDKVKALVEPIMIVVLAVIIGTIVLAIMVPMFEIFKQVK